MTAADRGIKLWKTLVGEMFRLASQINSAMQSVMQPYTCTQSQTWGANSRVSPNGLHNKTSHEWNRKCTNELGDDSTFQPIFPRDLNASTPQHRVNLDFGYALTSLPYDLPERCKLTRTRLGRRLEQVSFGRDILLLRRWQQCMTWKRMYLCLGRWNGPIWRVQTCKKLPSFSKGIWAAQR